MELDETRVVSFAPEQGEVTPFERLCREHCVRRLTADDYDLFLSVSFYEFHGAIQGDSAEHVERLTTDDGTAIPFDTALQLASAQLLARLGDG